MAESQKQSPSPVNSKEKDSLLGDVDFGKDFLSSWKTMSMEEGDPMDFDFGTVSKGKKKAFNFDKLDVDFALDGDLDKISSFKVDISDLDITSPPKRAGKSNERSKESAGGNHQLKQDRFTLPFDFDELDCFSFESSLMKGGKQSNKNQNSEETSVRSECQGSGTYPTDGIGASEVSLTPKLPSSVSAPTPHIETPVGDLGGLDSTKEDFASNSARNDNGPSKSATLQNEVASEETRISPEKTTTAIIQEKKQESYQQEKTSPPESCDEETMQDLSVQSVSANELIQHTASEVLVEVRSLATKASKNAAGEQGVLCQSVAGLGFSRENSVSENLPAPHIATSPGNNAVGSDNNVPLGYADGAEPAEGDSYSENALTISVSMEAMHDTKASGDDQNTNEIHLTPLSSGTTVRKLVQMKEKQTGIFQSKYFMKSDETESQSRKAPSTQAKPTMFGGKRGYGQHGATDEGREGVEARDAQSGRKLVGISRPQSGELNNGESVQPVQLGSRSGVKGLKDVREHFSASGALYGTKMFVSSSTCVRGVMKVEPVQESEKKQRNLPTHSSGFNPSSSPEQTNKSTAQNCTDPRVPSSSIVSVQKSGDVCSEGNKTSPPKSGRSLLDLASLKISRTVGANPQSTKYTIQKEIKSLRNTEQNMDLEGSAISKMAHSVRTEKRTPPTPLLKRKTFEGLNADILSLNPSKRLSPSATDSRNGERTEIVIDKEAGSHKDPADGSPNNAFNVFQTSTPDPLQEVNMIELETPLVMENTINVEKAEAYTNELENICNMLKKKHELAKEILVRAIVNNNKLLMLNHPIYEEKISIPTVFRMFLFGITCDINHTFVCSFTSENIRKIQKFAAQLMSK